MRRREFIKAIAGSLIVWPLTVVAQLAERMRRIGILMHLAANDPEGQARLAVFLRELHGLGWTDGHNVQIETRWAAADTDRFRAYAAELVALAPEVIVAASTPAVVALQQATRTVPIVFVTVVDPVGAGLVSNLARPGGNTTGFAQYEYVTSGKWLELLKQIAPDVTRVAVLRDPVTGLGIGQFAAIQAVAPSFAVELSPIDERDAGEIKRGIAAFARSVNGGLIVTASPA
jgi:ABC-type uncharacterized transport system substrate-binding protein